MLDVTEQLERYASRLGDEVDAISADAIFAEDALMLTDIAPHTALANGHTGAPSPHRISIAVVGVAATLLLIVGAVAVLRNDEPAAVVNTGDNDSIPDGSVDPGPSPTEAESEWVELDPGPLDPRQGAAVVWADDELIVLAGERHGDGAAYDPPTRQWRRIADSPFEAGVVDAVWMGSELFVIGPWVENVSERPTASYDPATDTWQELAAAPNVGDPYRNGLHSIGDKVVAPWIPAIYDTTTNTWTGLPAAAGGERFASIVADDRLILADHGFHTIVVDIETRSIETWPGPPDHGRDVGAEEVAAVAVGDTMVLVDDNGRVSTLDLTTGTWEVEIVLDPAGQTCVPEAGALDDGRSYWDLCSRVEIRTPEGQWGQALDQPLSCCYPTTATDGRSVYTWESNDDTPNDPDAPYKSFRIWEPPIEPTVEEAVTPAAELDPVANGVCPLEAAGMRIFGGRLVAGFDTTVADVRGMTEPRAEQGDTPAIVCWYEDATFVGTLDASASTTDAMTIYIDGEIVHAQMSEGPTQRP